MIHAASRCVREIGFRPDQRTTFDLRSRSISIRREKTGSRQARFRSLFTDPRSFLLAGLELIYTNGERSDWSVTGSLTRCSSQTPRETRHFSGTFAQVEVIKRRKIFGPGSFGGGEGRRIVRRRRKGFGSKPTKVSPTARGILPFVFGCLDFRGAPQVVWKRRDKSRSINQSRLTEAVFLFSSAIKRDTRAIELSHARN